MWHSCGRKYRMYGETGGDQLLPALRQQQRSKAHLGKMLISVQQMGTKSGPTIIVLVYKLICLRMSHVNK